MASGPSQTDNEIETLAEEANGNIHHVFEAPQYWEALLIVTAIIAISTVITFVPIKCISVMTKICQKGEISNRTNQICTRICQILHNYCSFWSFLRLNNNATPHCTLQDTHIRRHELMLGRNKGDNF
uniref:Uncharacterized protein n=1 Tax=Parascaris equorum TaxID=6256 RepID=A0A914S6J7_PAREQ